MLAMKRGMGYMNLALVHSIAQHTDVVNTEQNRTVKVDIQLCIIKMTKL